MSDAFLRAAYEMGNASPVAGAYTPDWKSDKETHIESYLTQRPGDPGYLLSFISHEEALTTVPVTIDLESLAPGPRGHDHRPGPRGRRRNGYEGRVTERVTKSTYRETGWSLDRVTRRRLLYMGPYRRA